MYPIHSIFFLVVFSIEVMEFKKLTDDCIRTADLCRRKRLLCQLCHNQCPNLCLVFVLLTENKSKITVAVTRFELGPSGIGTDRSANCTTIPVEAKKMLLIGKL